MQITIASLGLVATLISVVSSATPPSPAIALPAEVEVLKLKLTAFLEEGKLNELKARSRGPLQDEYGKEGEGYAWGPQIKAVVTVNSPVKAYITLEVPDLDKTAAWLRIPVISQKFGIDSIDRVKMRSALSGRLSPEPTMKKIEVVFQKNVSKEHIESLPTLVGDAFGDIYWEEGKQPNASHGMILPVDNFPEKRVGEFTQWLMGRKIKFSYVNVLGPAGRN